MTLGDKIRKLRRDAGMTQAQLAERIHVSRAAVARWENENGTPDIANIKALASLFQIDVSVLLNEELDLEQHQKFIRIDPQESVEQLLIKKFPDAYKISPVILQYDFNKAEKVINILTFGIWKYIWQLSHWKEYSEKYFYIDLPQRTYLAKITQNRIILKQLSYRPQNIMGEFFVDNKKFLDLNQNIIK